MNQSALTRVERVCAYLATSGQPISFTAVAEQPQISRATLTATNNCAPSSTNTALGKPTPAP